MELLSTTEELEIFNCVCIQDIIEYKWDQYGWKHHFMGMAMHMFYTFMIIIYVKNAYLFETNRQSAFSLLLAIGIIYPCRYEFSQFRKIGSVAYFGDIGNYIDCLYNWGSLVNVIL